MTTDNDDAKPGAMTDDKRAVAFHEAGHAVAAHFHRVAVPGATIKPDPDAGSLGRCHIGVVVRPDVEWDCSGRNQLRVERLAMVCLAGPYAMRKFLADADRLKEYDREQAESDDFHKAVNALGYFEDGAVLEKYLHYMEARAEAFVASRWWAITAVAEALLQRTTLKGPDVRRVIAEALQARLHIFYSPPRSDGAAPPSRIE